MESHNKRKGAAVLGSPIAHSLSPLLHQAAYNALGLSDWTYRAIECPTADLRLRLCELEALGLAGASLTMPLKRDVLTAVDQADHWSSLVGAANTVLFDDSDEWRAANTDVPGLVSVLRSFGEYDEVPEALIIGAGATAASSLAALSELRCARAVIVARRASAVAELEPLAAKLDIELTARPWSELHTAVTSPLAISTTPAGVTDGLAVELSAASGTLFDVVYAPWPTSLARAWAGMGGRVIGGIELLIEQAALQVELMTGLEAPVAAMRDAGYAALSGRA